MFSTCPKSNFNFYVIFILSSANDFNLDQSKNLLFGKGLSQVSIGLKTKEAVVFSRIASGQQYIIQSIYPIKL